MNYRRYSLGSYEEMRATHRWEIPDRYNIASDVCDKHPRDKLAMIWEDWRGTERRVSWGELQDTSNRFANALEAHGVERGDRVATLLPSLPETAAVFLGTYKAGAILLSMSVLYGDQGIEHRLRDSGAKALVTDSANRARVPEGLAEVVFVIDSPEAPGERASGDLDLKAELERASDRYEPVDTAADDPAQLYYSSGTTGLAKGILHAHRYLPAHEEFEFCHDVHEGELFHGMGEWAWAAGICPLLGPWRYGATQLVYARRAGFDPDEQLRFLSKHAVHNVFTTPTALRSMTAIPGAGTRYPLDRLRIVCSAGEPLNPEVIRWFREQYGITVLDYYGLTESYPLCANYPTVPVREGSMGLPMPGWDVAILDEDDHPVPPGERGEICLRARSNPHYPLGYWNRPDETEADFGGEWFHTKDAAQADEDGYCWYAGRADDVISSAGYRIGPFEVESACVEHPAVREAAAIEAPDERRGGIVKAFVVLSEGYAPSDEVAEDIKRFVREHHSAYAYPREIEFAGDLPKTLTGKIRRVELREAERERRLRARRPVGAP
jgi:acetyl-CoA synthetase